MQQMSDKDPNDLSTHWATTAAHSLFVSAIRREMEDYLRIYVDYVVIHGAREDHEILEERRAVIALLLASFIEAIANLFSSFSFSPEQLASIDRMSVVEKFAVVPSFKLKSYAFDRSGALYHDLKSIVKFRNAFVHMRPEFSLEDKRIHKGNVDDLDVLTHAALLKWMSLPNRLVRHLESHDRSGVGSTMVSVSDAWEIDQDWQARLKSLSDRAKKKRDGPTSA